MKANGGVNVDYFFDRGVSMEHTIINLKELITKVEELKGHWVGKYLVKAYVSCYRGKKSPVDLSQFNNLDSGNQQLFLQILHMRSHWLYDDEQLFQCEKKLKQLVGIK